MEPKIKFIATEFAATFQSGALLQSTLSLKSVWCGVGNLKYALDVQPVPPCPGHISPTGTQICRRRLPPAAHLPGAWVNHLDEADLLILFSRAQHIPCNELSYGLELTFAQMCGLVSSVRMGNIGLLACQTEIVALAPCSYPGIGEHNQGSFRGCCVMGDSP